MSPYQDKNRAHTVSSPTASGRKTQVHQVETDKDCSVFQNVPTLQCVQKHSESKTKHTPLFMVADTPSSQDVWYWHAVPFPCLAMNHLLAHRCSGSFKVQFLASQ